VFKGEVEETIIKVKMVVTNLLALKEVYEQYRKKVSSFFKHGEPKEWEFAPVLVFHRYDKFIERLQLVYVSFIIKYPVKYKIVSYISHVSTPHLGTSVGECTIGKGVSGLVVRVSDS